MGLKKVSANVIALLLSQTVGVVALAFAIYLQWFYNEDMVELGLGESAVQERQNVAIALWVLGGVTVIVPLLLNGMGKVKRRRMRYRR